MTVYYHNNWINRTLDWNEIQPISFYQNFLVEWLCLVGIQTSIVFLNYATNIICVQFIITSLIQNCNIGYLSLQESNNVLEWMCKSMLDG